MRTLGRGSPTVTPLRVRVAPSASAERGGDLLRRPTEVTHAPPAMHRCGELYLFGLVSCGDAGAARPRPSPKSLRLSGLSFGGIVIGRRHGAQRARRACRGHGARRVRRDAEHARLPLSVTATAVTPSPPGKGASPLFMRALGRGSPTVAPLRVRVARSAMVERGGDLLRRPTEATPAPSAMGRCGEPRHS